MPQKLSILIVEDEADLAELVRYNLEREGYLCQLAMDGHAALAAIRTQTPDLIVLDRMLPGVSGDDVMTELRREPRTASVPVIMLTAKAEESDELVGFALGADDYITKPFSIKVLLARVAAVFRRATEPETGSAVLTAGPIVLDVERVELTVSGKPVSLTATEFRLLRALMVAGGRVLSRAQLIDAAMGTGIAVTDRTIDVHVTALRRKLGTASEWIQTVRGIGYTCRQPG